MITHEVIDARYWDIEAVEPWHKNHKDYALAAREFRTARSQ